MYCCNIVVLADAQKDTHIVQLSEPANLLSHKEVFTNSQIILSLAVAVN